MDHISISTKRSTTLSVLLLVTLLVSLLSILPVHAQVQYEISMDPSINEFSSATTSLGYTWDVSVFIKNSTDMQKVGNISHYQVKLYFDPAHVNVAAAWLPKTDPLWVFNSTAEHPRTTVSPPPVIDNAAGYVLLRDSIIPPGDAFKGAGRLAVIRFRIVGLPPKGGELFSEFAINHEDTFIKDNEEKVGSAEKKNGSFKYFWPPELPPARVYMIPSVNEFSIASFPLGHALDVSVAVQDVTGLSSYQVKLYFNPAHVMVSTEIRLLNSTFLNITKPEGTFWEEQEPWLFQMWNLTSFRNQNATGEKKDEPRLGQGDTVYMSPLVTNESLEWKVKNLLTWNESKGAYEILLSAWMPTVLPPDYLWVFKGKSLESPTPSTDNVAGYTLINSSITTGIASSVKGNLAKIRLRITAVPSQYDEMFSAFMINHDETFLKYSDGTTIPSIKYDGSFRYVGHPPPARVHLDPSASAFTTATAQVGHTWSVTVWVDNATDLAAYQVKLNFNSAHVNVVDVPSLETDPLWVFYGKSTVSSSPEVGNGYVLVGDSIVSGDSFAGTGKLTTVSFRIASAPSGEDTELSSAFAINHDETFLKYPNGTTNPFVKKYDGSFRYAWVPSPPTTGVYVDPSVNAFSTADTSLGYEWTVSVWVQDVKNLMSYQVKLCFNPAYVNISKVDDATLHRDDPLWVFKGKVTVPTDPTISYLAGYVLIGETTLSPLDSFSGKGKLAIIKFRIVSAPGEFETLSAFFTINNVDTNLQNSEQEAIPNIKADGSFEYAWPLPAKPRFAMRRADGQPWPLEFGPSPAPTGQTFQVNVTIENLGAEWGLTGANITIAYNATVVDATGDQADVTINTAMWEAYTVAVNRNSDPAILDYIILNVSGPLATPTGNVAVAVIQYTIVYSGPWGVDVISPLDFVEIVLEPTFIQQETPANGKFVIKGLTIEARLPPHTSGNNEYVKNKLETFDVEVWINDLTADKRLIAVQFRLKYNATLLQILDVTEGSFLSSFPNSASPDYTWFNTITEPDGLFGPHVLVGVNLFPNASHQYHNFPNGSGPVATITFQGTYRGFYPERNYCTLELDDVLLLDDELDSISVSAVNGYYEILSFATPEASFTYKSSIPGAVHLNATVPAIFDASESHDINGSIVGYTWDFGDGNITELTQPTTGHVYNAPGNYVVNLTVTDDDSQTMSTTESIIVSRLTSTLTISVTPESGVSSQSTTVNGTITRETSPVYVAGVNVLIQYKLQGETAWKQLTTTTTDSEGRYGYTWVAMKETFDSSETFEVNASWTGDMVTEPAQRATIFRLNMAKSIVSIDLSPSTLTIGSKTTISGSITPARESGVNATIFYRSRGGAWSALGTVGTDSAGNYKYDLETTAAGIFEVRSSYAGDEDIGPVQSSIATLTVNRAASTMGIYVYPAKTSVGSDISVYGSIQPTKTEVNVTISFKQLDSVWRTLTEVKTDSSGEYSATISFDEVGTYEIKASWQGDSNTLPAEDIATITVEAQPINILLYIMIAILIITITAATITYYKKTKKQEPEATEVA